MRPSVESWEAAQEPFKKVIAELEPDVVWVLGQDLAGHLPELPENIVVCETHHPSSAFKYERWQPIFNHAIKCAQEKKAMK